MLIYTKDTQTTKEHTTQILLSINPLLTGSWLLILALVSGCFSGGPAGASGESYDFVSTPVIYQVVSEKIHEGDMLPSEKTYGLQTCLKDRINLVTMALNEFTVDGKDVISDEEGCIVWTKNVKFNPYAQSGVSEDNFEITSNGKYPGRLVIRYALNPWTGIRPTTTAEFIEYFPLTDSEDYGLTPSGKISMAVGDTRVSQNTAQKRSLTDSMQPDDKDAKFSQLKVQSVYKQEFTHNVTARGQGVHLGFIISPLLEVYDASGASHNLIPLVGKVNVYLDILSLGKNKSFTEEHIAQSKTIKQLALKDLVIESGKIHINEQISAVDIQADENILLKFRIESPTEWGSDNLIAQETLFFVRQSKDSEYLQEASTQSTVLSDDGEQAKLATQGALQFFAEDPKVSFVSKSQISTTSMMYDLLFSTRLIHKNSEQVVKNLDLYVTYNSNTQKVKVGPDGQLRYSFPYEFHIYDMQGKPQLLSFNVTNEEETFAIDIPLYLKPWEPAMDMALNPQDYSIEFVENQIKNTNLPKPEVYVEKLSLDTATPVDYKVASDLSLQIHHSYNFVADVKVRSHASEVFGGERLLDAPNGCYKLDVYLTCPQEGLANRSLYNVDVADSLQKVTLNKAKSEEELQPLCPGSLTSFDIEVESGQALGKFEVTIPEPRMIWSRSQMTLVLTPYKVTDEATSCSVADSQRLLSTSFTPAPVARTVIMEDFAKASKRVAFMGIDHRKPEQALELKSFNQVKQTVAKWQVAHPYITHLNSLDSDYLTKMHALYLSLDDKPYSTVNFHDKEDEDTEGLSKVCDVESGSCLRESSTNLSLNYDEFAERFDTSIGERNFDISLDEMKNIVWNKPGNRLNDLVRKLCNIWSSDFVRLFHKKRKQLYIDNSNLAFGPYGESFHVMDTDFQNIRRQCIHGFGENKPLAQPDLSSVSAIHHLKGPVVEVSAKDAGVDVLHFSQKNASGMRNNLSFYSSAHVDVLGSFFSLIKNLSGFFAGAAGYTFTMMGEYEVTNRDDFGGGMTHYSHWTTVQMNLHFQQPKYCLTLRLDPYFSMKHFAAVRDGIKSRTFYAGTLDYHSDVVPFLEEFLDNIEHSLSIGYLICTEEQPPVGDDSHNDLEMTGGHVVGVETYRFASPRFESAAVYDSTREEFRDWVYPLRGQSDYLRFIHSMTLLGQNGISSLPVSGNMFDVTSKLFTWFMKDKRVTQVNQHMYSTTESFIKFPKRFIYSRFAVIPPSIGGYFNY
ncbi:MAG: hypothetical protein OXC40_05960 [Proteobacteria bacterium]|nr:hypothetical protein [Pseudomonadota bacterium]